MNGLNLERIKYFDKHIKTRTKGVKRLFILNGYDESYNSVEFERYCQNNEIITFYILVYLFYWL